MTPRTLGSSTISISPLIMGTWQAGRHMWTDIDDADSIRAIRSAIDAGVIDIRPHMASGLPGSHD